MMVFDIPNHQPDRDFVRAFNVAGQRIQSEAERRGLELLWIKAVPYGPSIEHLSFFCGGQAYFVQLIDSSGETVFPGGTKEGLLRIAKEYEGFACWMPMQRSFKFNSTLWKPINPDWGLVEVLSGKPIQPEKLVTKEPKKVTRWELHDFAIQIVRERLEQQGQTILSWNSDPEVEPAIWFKNTSKPEWVAVSECFGPASLVSVPEGLEEIVRPIIDSGYQGWWAPVGFAPLVRKTGRPEGLYRGEGADVDYKGLQPLPF